MGRTFAIGDVHGCLTALTALIDAVAPASDDTIVMLGDYIDRGPNSKGVVDFLLRNDHRVRLNCLRGNHEVMICQSRHDEVTFRGWVNVGGKETLESYRPETESSLSLDDITERHWRFFEADLLPYYENDTHIFVHANPDPLVPMEEQADYSLYWEFCTPPRRHLSGKTVVRGHVAQEDGIPSAGRHEIAIDTGAYDGGWLTCLEPSSGCYWQANEQGETRTSTLEINP